MYIYIYIYVYVICLTYSYTNTCNTIINNITSNSNKLLTEILLPRIARLASNRSTGSCLYNFKKRTSSNNWN